MPILDAVKIIPRALLACLLAICLSCQARAEGDTVAIIASGRDCSIRGMSIPEDGAIWVSGSNGHVGRSTDEGANWLWGRVPGYEQTDFRDIHAFDSLRAIIMGIGNPANILKTIDGGRSWKLVFTRDTAGMFLDALDFRNDREGICIGDPLDAGGGRKAFFVIRTMDGGDTWQQDRPDRVPTAGEGEAVFSASGTNIALLNGGKYDYAFISGGRASNLYLVGRGGNAFRVFPLRVNKGGESAGAFSMATDRKREFYCVGGDYKESSSIGGNLVWTTDRGKSWKTAAIAPPSGYRSCIRAIGDGRLVACGSNGVDLSGDPHSWVRISGEGFHVCAVSPDRKLIFLAGANGRIGLIRL